MIDLVMSNEKMRVTVSCGVTKICFIWAYFFEEGDCTVTVNSQRYLKPFSAHKDMVPARWVYTLDELKVAISQEVTNISPAMLEKGFDRFTARLEDCMVKEGNYLKDVLFRS
ncbi:hypothetical protein J6590_080000 [Homalodisca vitripennis]|nr:hypothetical protein J6590_080000 [Homalodisca vitripennis]